MIMFKNGLTDFISSNAPETYSLWVSTTTYTAGQFVIYENRVYRSVVNNNTGNIPTENIGTLWTFYGVSNKYAMLDEQSTTYTTISGSPLIVEFATNSLYDSLVLGYYTASSVLIEFIDSFDNVLSSITEESSVNQNVYDYWDYIYEPYNLTVDGNKYYNIPYQGVKIRITFGNAGLTEVRCGFLGYGQGINMGSTLDKVSFGITSYSLKEFDAYGNLMITKRGVQDLVDFDTIYESKYFTDFRRNIKTYKDEIMIFVLDESEASDFENLVTLAIIQDCKQVAEVKQKSVLAWSLVEVI